MEYLHELLLNQANPFKSAAMFGLVFDTAPTYEELNNGTPRLALIFKLNEDFRNTKSLSVSLNSPISNTIIQEWYSIYNQLRTYI